MHPFATRLALVVALWPVVSLGQPIAPQKPAPAPAKEAAAGAKEEMTADRLLTELEATNKTIRTLSAMLRFSTVAGNLEGNDRQIREGTLYFRNAGEQKGAEGTGASDGGTAACVKFSTLLQVASGKLIPENRTFIVNGGVVLERIEDEKIANRIRIGEPGKPGDPLKLGKGPFPLPFGQKKADVLSRFSAQIVPFEEKAPESKTFRERLAETYQLKLTPREGAGISPNVTEIRVWYQKKDLFPILAQIIEKDGAFKEFLLIAPRTNETLPEGVFDLTVPAGWKVEEKVR